MPVSIPVARGIPVLVLAIDFDEAILLTSFALLPPSLSLDVFLHLGPLLLPLLLPLVSLLLQ